MARDACHLRDDGCEGFCWRCAGKAVLSRPVHQYRCRDPSILGRRVGNVSQSSATLPIHLRRGETLRRLRCALHHASGAERTITMRTFSAPRRRQSKVAIARRGEQNKSHANPLRNAALGIGYSTCRKQPTPKTNPKASSQARRHNSGSPEQDTLSPIIVSSAFP
jgi:hypothetical protein